MDIIAKRSLVRQNLILVLIKLKKKVSCYDRDIWMAPAMEL